MAGLGADAGDLLQEGVGGLELRVGVDETGDFVFEIDDLFFEESGEDAVLTAGEGGGVVGGLVIFAGEEVDELVAAGEQFDEGVADGFAGLCGSGAGRLARSGRGGERRWDRFWRGVRGLWRSAGRGRVG